MPAIILICLGIILGISSDMFTKVPHSRSVNGEIVSLEPRKTHDEGRMTYKAYVEYFVNDIPYTVKSKYRSSTFHIGDGIRVVYNEQNPKQAVVRPKREVYLVMIGYIVAGIIIGYSGL